MKKFSNATLAAARHPQAMARLVLAFVASILVILLALMGMSSGPNGATVFAQATESATPTPADTGPAIKLLNPNPTYNPDFVLPPADPVISDKYDGVDGLYHVVAITRNAPANSAVEAYFEPTGLNEITVGTLTLVPGSTDTWELFWDVPDNLPVNSGTFKVRLFQATAGGFEEVANDETPAEIDDSAETVELSWPSQNGQLGFHKPKGGFWRTVLEGTTSEFTFQIRMFYSVAAPGAAVAYKPCGTAGGGTDRGDDSKAWIGTCTLAGKDLPSQVTAVAAVAVEDNSGFEEPEGFTQESADAHRVQPYVQAVEQMVVELVGTDSPNTASYPSGQRRQVLPPAPPPPPVSPTQPQACLEFEATVKDHLGRPVQGANVDVNIQGPSDQVAFAEDASTGASTTSNDSLAKNPDKDGHSTESRLSCNDFADLPGDNRGQPRGGQQGEHNVPGGPDIKHLEVGNAGTGLSGGVGAGPGDFRFLVISTQPGFTEVTAWVDDEPIPNEATTREADDDVLEAGEATTSLRAQWLPAPLAITFSPRADSAPVGECNKYTVRARAGSAVVPGINVDVHAQGPNNDLDFCDPGDGTPRRAPDQPAGDAGHQAEDEGESSHKSTSPDVPEIQHTEGETDEAGNFVIGITSTATGQTQLSAWADGEPGQDNDVRATSEAGGSASKSWVGSAADAEVRFVNPSAYAGNGDKISNKRDADGNFHIVARVDLPDVVAGVEFFIGSSGTFTKIGDGTRVGTSDTWEFFWPVNVPDGSYTLRAQITGTEKREDRAVTVNNQPNANDPRDVPFEAAEITRPLNATSAPFDKGATTITGVASSGARGVDLYYTKTAARETRDSASWIRCGGVTLPGGTNPQNFEGKCTLGDPDGDGTKDFPVDVTGVAAIAYRCDPATGCTTVQGRETGKIYDTGDAHRVFGFEANPVVTIEPAEAAGQTTQCQRFELSVTDAAGLGIADANVDVHVTGPTDSVEFCDLADGTPRRAPDRAGHAASPSQGDEGIHTDDGSDAHHTEGETDTGGKFVFGITSGTSGDSQILGWADQDDNDELDSNEKSDTSIMHWGGGGGANKCTIKGNGKDNVLRGTRGADIICGGGGDDTIRARGGKDKVYGGGGNDVLRGNGGGDLIKGGPGSDRLNGGRGRDRCRPGRGRDSRVNCES